MAPISFGAGTHLPVHQREGRVALSLPGDRRLERQDRRPVRLLGSIYLLLVSRWLPDRALADGANLADLSREIYLNEVLLPHASPQVYLRPYSDGRDAELPRQLYTEAEFCSSRPE